MIKLVAFDLDGTILDSLPDLLVATNTALEKEGLPKITLEQIRSYVGDGLTLLIKRAIAPTQNNDVQHRVKATFDKYYGAHYCDKSVLYSGIRELLEELRIRQIKVAVYSNKPEPYVKQIMKQLFGEYPFVAAMGQCDAYKTKPDATQLKLLQAQLDFKNEECLYVGDSDVDMKTAGNADFCAVGVLWGYRGKDVLIDSGATHLVESPYDILPLLGA